MKPYQMFLILAAIYVAPHADWNYSRWISALCILCGIVAMVAEGRKP